MAGGEITIRKAEARDVPALKRVLRETFEGTWLPHISVDPETYQVIADGQLLTCEPASVLPMAQRYFLF